MRLHQRSQADCTEVSGKKPITHAFQALRQFFAWSRQRHFKWDSVVSPNLTNNPSDCLSRAEIWRMIFRSVNDRDTGLAAHEPIENLFTDGRHAGHAQCLVDYRRYDRYRLSPADQRIAMFTGVHCHKVGAIYNNCTHGSMLNV